MRNIPHAKLRCRIRAWYIDLTWEFQSRTVNKSIGPYTFDDGKRVYEFGAESGRWIKEGIGDR